MTYPHKYLLSREGVLSISLCTYSYIQNTILYTLTDLSVGESSASEPPFDYGLVRSDDRLHLVKTTLTRVG